MEAELLEPQPHRLDECLGGVAVALEVGVEAEPDAVPSTIVGANPSPNLTREPSRSLGLMAKVRSVPCESPRLQPNPRSIAGPSRKRVGREHPAEFPPAHPSRSRRPRAIAPR